MTVLKKIKLSEKRISNPSTIEEAFSNVKFQFDEVYAWLQLDNIKCAEIKAECLKDELEVFLKMVREQQTTPMP